MKNLLLSLIVVYSVIGCRESGPSQDSASSNVPDSSNTAKTPTSFFPVTAYLQRQIQQLDSLKVTFLQVSKLNNQSDSSWLKSSELKPLLAPFVADYIDKQNLLSIFKETQFNDETTEAITLTYEPSGKPLPDSMALRKWIVYVHPETGNVKRIYMVRVIKENGLPITQQLTWVSEKSAHLVNYVSKPDGSSIVIKDVQWIWDFNQEQDL